MKSVLVTKKNLVRKMSLSGLLSRESGMAIGLIVSVIMAFPILDFLLRGGSVLCGVGSDLFWSSFGTRLCQG